jgi:hypothetical protein
MGPQEKRLTSELAIYLVRSCSRAQAALPPGETLDLAGRRRWFERAYQEWLLTPRVDLAGRTPHEVIATERAQLAAERESRDRATSRRPGESMVEIYTNLPRVDFREPAD